MTVLEFVAPMRTLHPWARAAQVVRRWWKSVALLVALVLLWQGLVSSNALPKFELAPPTEVASYLVNNKLFLTESMEATLEEVAIAFAISVVLSIGTGLLVNQVTAIRESVLPLLVVSQVIPSIAIAPLLVLLLGTGIAPKIVTAVIISYFPLAINTITGIARLDPDVRDFGKSLGLSKGRAMLRLSLPNALPSIFVGARISITLAVIGAVVGEFVTANQGLGYMILQGTSMQNPPMVFAAIVVLAVMGIVLFSLVRLLERRVVPWGSEKAAWDIDAEEG